MNKLDFSWLSSRKNGLTPMKMCLLHMFAVQQARG